MKKWAAAIAIVILVADIIVDIAIVATGLHPIGSVLLTAALLAETFVAAALGIYIAAQWKGYE